MRQLIIDSLELILENTNDNEVGIFETFRNREEVTVSVNDEENGCGQVDGEDNCGVENGDDTEDQSTEAESAESCTEEEQETTREVTTQIRRDTKVRILTVEGAQFVNAILDSWVAKRPTDYFMNELYLIGAAKHPNLNLFSLIDESGVTYYDQDKEIFDIHEEAFILSYPGKTDLEVAWIVDEDGVPYEPLSPERYEMVWKRIIKASKLLDSSKVTCTKQVKKEVKYWNNLNIAYDDAGRLMRKSGATVTLDELMKVSILKPKWLMPAKKFAREETERNWSHTDIITWLCSPLDSKDVNVAHVNTNDNARNNPSSRMNQIASNNNRGNNNNK